jgi:hypothetical protein
MMMMMMNEIVEEREIEICRAWIEQGLINWNQRYFGMCKIRGESKNVVKVFKRYFQEIGTS